MTDAWGAADPVHFHLVDRTQSWVDPHQYTVVYRIDLSAAPLLDHFYIAVLSSAHLPSTMSAGATYSTTLHIQSAAKQAWPAGAVRVGYRWYAKDPTVVAGLVAPPPVHATVLTPLPATVAPGAALDVPVSFVAPTQPGTYTLRIDLVYERSRWFADYGNIALSVPVTVTAKV